MKKLVMIVIVMVMVLTNLLMAEASYFREGRAYVAGQNKHHNTWYVCYDSRCIQYDLDMFVDEIVDEHYCDRAYAQHPKDGSGIYKVICDEHIIGYIKTKSLYNY